MCKPLPTHAKGEDISNLTDMYTAKKNFSWKQCDHVCTDSA
jgi:hypothetical protein